MRCAALTPLAPAGAAGVPCTGGAGTRRDGGARRALSVGQAYSRALPFSWTASRMARRGRESRGRVVVKLGAIYGLQINWSKCELPQIGCLFDIVAGAEALIDHKQN